MSVSSEVPQGEEHARVILSYAIIFEELPELKSMQSIGVPIRGSHLGRLWRLRTLLVEKPLSLNFTGTYWGSIFAACHCAGAAFVFHKARLVRRNYKCGCLILKLGLTSNHFILIFFRRISSLVSSSLVAFAT